MARSRSDAHAARNEQVRNMFASLAEVTGMPPTSTTITGAAQTLKLDHNVENVPESQGAKIHWLGDANAHKLLLYYHGTSSTIHQSFIPVSRLTACSGGFALPPTEGHPKFLADTVQTFEERTGQKVRIAFLEYTLSGVEKYPRQISQAVQALKLVIGKGYRPSNIVIGGDSAGGNISLNVIAHILHPLEGVPELKLTEDLAGVFLISPWISFDISATSKENGWSDIFTADLLQEMADLYVPPGGERDLRTEPVLADSSWWKGFPARSVLNVWGELEILRPSIVDLGRQLQDAGVPVKNVECPLHVHADCVLDAGTGLAYGTMATEIWNWLSDVLK